MNDYIPATLIKAGHNSDQLQILPSVLSSTRGNQFDIRSMLIIRQSKHPIANQLPPISPSGWIPQLLGHGFSVNF
ncbi:hypothetical protein ASPBRDRAFT_400078 [Aspergillus brasiliensis CBS 101740]|uniref:Uncharacterized protein n=1 Tax=Aspergillus brasiliensis (strain CBS 101740 / IMI 381727 / IBT 21946) TaxID=767769 RepID=A0A1L9UX49_ASPBC|nr:hypothetical protein ASPBRDRAFT_400078 [Aspergillus brasiliensis CBS 101740]